MPRTVARQRVLRQQLARRDAPPFWAPIGGKQYALLRHPRARATPRQDEKAQRRCRENQAQNGLANTRKITPSSSNTGSSLNHLSARDDGNCWPAAARLSKRPQ